MRRRDLLMSLPALGLAACGGGGSGPGDNDGVRLPRRYTPVGAFAITLHAAVTLANGHVIVLGGDRGGVALSDGIERFDPNTRQWSHVGELLNGRESHTATLLRDGRILVVGGQTGLDGGPLAELVDPASGQSRPAGSLNQPRTSHTASLLNDGRVLVTGGSGRRSAELWDPATGQWRLLSSRMQHARVGHAATLLADGRVLVSGGAGELGAYVFAELFDPRTESFTPLDTGITEQRSAHVAWRARDGSVLLVGGEVYDGRSIQPLASTLKFDPATQRFTPATPLGRARTLAAAAALGDDGVLLIGGQTATDLATSSAVAWRNGRSEEALAPLPRARVWHTVNQLPDGRLLIVGGDDGRGGFVTEALLCE
jgi:WD40 repeat protein